MESIYDYFYMCFDCDVTFDWQDTSVDHPTDLLCPHCYSDHIYKCRNDEDERLVCQG